MDSRQAKKFRARWQAVAVVEAKEQVESSITLRWQQTNAIFQLAMGLGLPMSKENNVETKAVLHRWALLKETTI